MLPNDYLLRMKEILKDEYPLYLKTFDEPNVKAIKVNTNKITVDEFVKICPFSLEKIPYTADSFYVTEPSLGNHPFHHAGLFYMQDPAAMIPANILEIKPNWFVLDMCAAPGGKSIGIASKLTNGVLISNEINYNRSKILYSNIERMGLKNTIILNNDSYKLKEKFKNAFDLIFLDAPCSGEGMFRKDKNAINEWNENLKFYNKKRQLEILSCANSLLKNGGYLIYSTCTYNTIENESVINGFCNEFGYKIFSPCQDVIDNTFGGITLNGNVDLSKTRHFFPFLSKGEGQYVACLQKLGEDLQEKQPLLNSNLTQMEQKLVEDFFNKNLTNFDLKNFVFYKIGNYINVMPAKTVDFGNIKYLCYGVAIAEIVKDRLIPTQQFFSSYGKNFKSQLNLSTDGSLYKKYLLGEQISFNQVENDKNATLCYDNNSNYASVLVDGMSIGGVKIVDGVLKNHYPKALRTNKVE